jgi:uncharacterized protein (DUF433 family)
VFKGRRVPVKALFENIEEGASMDDFLKWFPGVTREQVLAVLAHAERSGKEAKGMPLASRRRVRPRRSRSPKVWVATG